MPELLIATTNPGKLVEIESLLNGLEIDLRTPAQLRLETDVEENGHSYAENAALKGIAYARASGLLTLADDSGLEVDALNGQPGLHSARFSPDPNATDADRRRLLLQALQGQPRPWSARFRCIVTLVRPGKGGRTNNEEVHYAEGICEGEIIPEERGQNGFGYDPIFFIPELGRTMAELTRDEKNRLSHRARAVQAALPILVDLLNR